MDLGALLQYAAPWALSKLFGGGDQDTNQQAQEGQMQLAQAMMNMQKDRHRSDMGLRNPAMLALRNRMKQQMPRILPGRTAITNPYRNMRKMSRNPIATGNTTGGNRGFTRSPNLLSSLQRTGYSPIQSPSNTNAGG
jgi:hypothetical protein